MATARRPRAIIGGAGRRHGSQARSTSLRSRTPGRAQAQASSTHAATAVRSRLAGEQARHARRRRSAPVAPGSSSNHRRLRRLRGAPSYADHAQGDDGACHRLPPWIEGGARARQTGRRAGSCSVRRTRRPNGSRARRIGYASRVRILRTLGAALLVAACGGEATGRGGATAGQVGGACTPDGTCNAGLACSKGVCTAAPDAGAGSGGATSAQEAGSAGGRTRTEAPAEDASLSGAAGVRIGGQCAGLACTVTVAPTDTGWIRVSSFGLAGDKDGGSGGGYDGGDGCCPGFECNTGVMFVIAAHNRWAGAATGSQDTEPGYCAPIGSALCNGGALYNADLSCPLGYNFDFGGKTSATPGASSVDPGNTRCATLGHSGQFACAPPPR